jgi:WhiB family redox-sensing transcriptional regulator
MSESWKERAACAGADTKLFFPAERGARSCYDYEEINNYCDLCAVREECLEYAVSNHIIHGIWGGKSAKQRRIIAGDKRRVFLQQL